MAQTTKKRIVYFIPTFPGLSETFIEREVSKLVDLGNLDVHIVSLNRGKGKTSEKVLALTEYQRLTWATSFSAIRYFFTRSKQVLEAFKIVKNPYLLLKSLGYTKKFQNLKPDNLHAHFFSAPSTSVIVASIILGIPFSISGHARDVFVEGTLIREKVRRATFASICNGFAWKKCVEIAGEDLKGKIRLIYHGIDTHLFELPAKKEKPSRPVIFMGGTRLVEKKGITYMLQASKILLERGLDHQLELVGAGPLLDDVRTEIIESNLQDNVFIHGNGEGMPFEEVKEFYKIADIFVLPSIETAEGDADGVPTVVIEAAIARVPIITTNAGGITDLVEDGITGLLIPQKDAKAIADAVLVLLMDPQLRSLLRQNAYNKAAEMFNIEKNAAELEKLLSLA